MEDLYLHGIVGGSKGESDLNIIHKLTTLSTQNRFNAVRVHSGLSAVYKYGMSAEQAATFKLPRAGTIGDGITGVKAANVGLDGSGNALILLVNQDSGGIQLRACKITTRGTLQYGASEYLSGWTWGTSTYQYLDMISMDSNKRVLLVGRKGSYVTALVVTVDNSLQLSYVESVSSIAQSHLYNPTVIYGGMTGRYIVAYRNGSGHAYAFGMNVSSSNIVTFSSATLISSAYTTYQWARGVTMTSPYGAIVVFTTSGTQTTFTQITISTATTPTLTMNKTTHVSSLLLGANTMCVVDSPRPYPDGVTKRIVVVGKKTANELIMFPINFTTNSGFTVPSSADIPVLLHVYGQGDIVGCEILPVGEPDGSLVLLCVYTVGAAQYFLYDLATVLVDEPWVKPSLSPKGKMVYLTTASFTNRAATPFTCTSVSDRNFRIVDVYPDGTSELSISTMALSHARGVLGRYVEDDYRPIGICLDSNTTATGQVRVQFRGIVKGVSVVPGSKYYIDENGNLTRRVTPWMAGIAISPNELLIRKAFFEGGMK